MLIQACLATASHWLAVSAVLVFVQAVRRLAASPRSSAEGNKGVKARTKGALDGKTEGAVVREQTHGGSLVRPV